MLLRDELAPASESVRARGLPFNGGRCKVASATASRRFSVSQLVLLGWRLPGDWTKIILQQVPRNSALEHLTAKPWPQHFGEVSLFS